MTEELKQKCTERAKIFQQAMESCHSSSPMDCIEWFADRIAELTEWLNDASDEKLKLQMLRVDLVSKIGNQEKRIEELEKENEKIKGDLELWESGACRATNLDNCGVVKELKAQIEKMKCCYNCANDTLEPPEVIGNGICEHCKNHDKWELAE